MSCGGTSSPLEGVIVTSLRPLACDFRRLRFSRSASFSRSCRASFFDGAPDRPSPLCLSSFIVNLSASPAEWTAGRKPCVDAAAAADAGRPASLCRFRRCRLNIEYIVFGLPCAQSPGEMIEFEVMIRRSRRWRRSARNWRPDWTATGPVEGAGCRPRGNSADFRRFWRPAPGSCALAPEGALWQGSPACRGRFGRFSVSGHAAVAQW